MSLMLNGKDVLQQRIEDTFEEAYEGAHHLHTKALWFGDGGVASMTAFRASCSVGAWSESIECIASSDTPVRTDMVLYDPHQFDIADVGSSDPHRVRLTWGSTTTSQALVDGNYTEAIFNADTTTAGKPGGGAPVTMFVPRIAVGQTTWAQVKCATASSVDFFIGIHEYSRGVVE